MYDTVFVNVKLRQQSLCVEDVEGQDEEWVKAYKHWLQPETFNLDLI